jgi:hypothetical protein
LTVGGDELDNAAKQSTYCGQEPKSAGKDEDRPKKRRARDSRIPVPTQVRQAGNSMSIARHGVRKSRTYITMKGSSSDGKAKCKPNGNNKTACQLDRGHSAPLGRYLHLLYAGRIDSSSCCEHRRNRSIASKSLARRVGQQARQAAQAPRPRGMWCF